MGPMGGLGIFGDLPQLAHDDRVNPFGGLPQLDPLPAAGSNHGNASHTHDGRVNMFGDLPQLDPLPAVGSNHAQALQTRADRFGIFGDLPHLDPLPAVKNCSSTALPAVGGKHAEEDTQQADLGWSAITITAALQLQLQ